MIEDKKLDNTSVNKPEQAVASQSKPERDEKGRLLVGHTANPNGRPKGSLSLVAILKDELEKEIVLQDKEGGNKEKIQIARALAKKIIKKALKDEDVRMIIDIINRVDGLPRQKIGFDDEDNSIKEISIKIVKHESPSNNSI